MKTYDELLAANPLTGMDGRPVTSVERFSMLSASDQAAFRERYAQMELRERIAEMDRKRYAKDEPEGTRWVTLGQPGEDGAHVLIDGDGNIHKGPEGMMGKNVSELGNKDVETATDSHWFKRTGDQIDMIQKALGYKRPVRGPQAQARIEKALKKTPGGEVISTLLALDDAGVGFTDGGFPDRGQDAYLQALDGKFTREQLDAASKWLWDTYGDATPMSFAFNTVNEARWIRGSVRAAKAKDGPKAGQSETAGGSEKTPTLSRRFVDELKAANSTAGGGQIIRGASPQQVAQVLGVSHDGILDVSDMFERNLRDIATQKQIPWATVERAKTSDSPNDKRNLSLILQSAWENTASELNDNLDTFVAHNLEGIEREYNFTPEMQSLHGIGYGTDRKSAGNAFIVTDMQPPAGRRGLTHDPKDIERERQGRTDVENAIAQKKREAEAQEKQKREAREKKTAERSQQSQAMKKEQEEQRQKTLDRLASTLRNSSTFIREWSKAGRSRKAKESLIFAIMMESGIDDAPLVRQAVEAATQATTKRHASPSPRTRYAWNEEDHPRADDGKFGSGSGGKADNDNDDHTIVKQPWTLSRSEFEKHSIDPEEATAIIAKRRAGDSRSKNKGDSRMEPSINRRMVNTEVPISVFSPEEIQHLRDSTDPERVREYVTQNIKTPATATIGRRDKQLHINDGAHRLLAAIDRGNTTFPVMVPVDAYDILKQSAPSKNDYTTHLTTTFPDIIQRDIDSDPDIDEDIREHWAEVIRRVRAGYVNSAASYAKRNDLDLGDYEPVFNERAAIRETADLIGQWREHIRENVDDPAEASDMRKRINEIATAINKREYHEAARLNQQLSDDYDMDYLPVAMLADMVTGEYFS